jgi:hypothetical protein
MSQKTLYWIAESRIFDGENHRSLYGVMHGTRLVSPVFYSMREAENFLSNLAHGQAPSALRKDHSTAE